MFGVTVPEKKIFVAPPPVGPTLKYVAVEEVFVPAGNTIAATGDTLLAVTVHPPDVLATDTLAYDV
jgi:hypothetical protein